MLTKKWKPLRRWNIKNRVVSKKHETHYQPCHLTVENIIIKCILSYKDICSKAPLVEFFYFIIHDVKMVKLWVFKSKGLCGEIWILPGSSKYLGRQNAKDICVGATSPWEDKLFSRTMRYISKHYYLTSCHCNFLGESSIKNGMPSRYCVWKQDINHNE